MTEAEGFTLLLGGIAVFIIAIVGVIGWIIYTLVTI